MADIRLPVLSVLALVCAAGAQSLSAGPERDLLARARADLARGDGIAAEVRLGQAREKGAEVDEVAALLGQAYLLQGNNAQARSWLAGRSFSGPDAAAGWRALGQLEHREGRLPEAGRAYDRALGITPRDATLWIDIGRLRYAGGEHMLAIEAIDRAVALDPGNARVVEAKGQLVRDQFGLVPGLVWFEAGLAAHPDDIGLLGELAASLGDLGRATEALAVTRHMLALDPRNPRAFFIQAVLAARGKDHDLARSMLNRTRGRLDHLPATMALDGLIHLQSGNAGLAAQSFERLVRLQPANPRATALLARALFVAGDHRYLVERLARAADDPASSPYLCAVFGRSLEILGDRTRAASYLDRASLGAPGFVHPPAGGGDFAGLLATGHMAEADELAERERILAPGNFAGQARAGDARLARGEGLAAFARYRQAARVREPESLFLREIEALSQARKGHVAAMLAESYLAGNPSSRVTARLVAGLSAQQHDWPRARLLLEYLARTGAGDDPRLWADIAFVRLRAGDRDAAKEAAMRAWNLQPSSPFAAQALGLVFSLEGRRRREASALLDRAREALGDTPLVIEGRRVLAGRARTS